MHRVPLQVWETEERQGSCPSAINLIPLGKALFLILGHSRQPASPRNLISYDPPPTHTHHGVTGAHTALTGFVYPRRQGPDLSSSGLWLVLPPTRPTVPPVPGLLRRNHVTLSIFTSLGMKLHRALVPFLLL